MGRTNKSTSKAKTLAKKGPLEPDEVFLQRGRNRKQTLDSTPDDVARSSGEDDDAIAAAIVHGPPCPLEDKAVEAALEELHEAAATPRWCPDTKQVINPADGRSIGRISVVKETLMGRPRAFIAAFIRAIVHW